MEFEDVNHLFLISIDLKFLTTQKTCRQSGLLQLFLQGVPLAFPLHCLLLDLPAKEQYHEKIMQQSAGGRFLLVIVGDTKPLQ